MKQLEYKPVNLRQIIALNEKNQLASKEYKKEGNFQTSFFNPYTVNYNVYQNLKTIDRYTNGDVSCEVLRRVSKKAFIINVCINHVITKIKPFLKPSTDTNMRGYVIKEKGKKTKESITNKSKKRKEIEEFLNNTGTEFDSDRDNFQKYCLKIVRDILELDQVSTEIGYTRGGRPYAFQAIDAATIHKVIPGQYNPDNIKYIQLIDGIPQAFYQDSMIVFDYQNPRTDIRHSFYGYSKVDQIIDVITSLINTFTYNAGNFTENKLPKGMILIDGNVSQDTVEAMEDYIADVMSGSPTNQWRIPIIPSGGEGENSGGIKWVALNGNNREMEFQQFMDFQVANIVAMFGCSMDELGLQNNKAQSIYENHASKIEASKSQILGDMLNFLQDYLNRIISIFYPDYELEFVGYEMDDPKTVLDLEKQKMESFMTVHEIRKEQGLEPLESEWADKVPANPQLVQLYQSEQAQSSGGMEDPGDMDDMDDMEGGEDMGDDDMDSEDTGDFGDSEDNENEEEDEENNEPQEDSESDFGVIPEKGPQNNENEGDFGDTEETQKSMNKSFVII